MRASHFMSKNFLKKSVLEKKYFKIWKTDLTFLNNSEVKTLFWRDQLLPLIWNKDYEDDTFVSVTSVTF